MTNGEMIKAIFPSAEIDIGNGGNDIWIAIDCWTIFKKEWWDAEYKEPTTKNDLGVDLVSRAEVLKLMQDNWHTHNGDWAMQESMDDIRALSSITPQEPRKGHWIGIDEDPHEDWECDNCGFVIWADENIEKFHYCPNCGAKMVEPQESEETDD